MSTEDEVRAEAEIADGSEMYRERSKGHVREILAVKNDLAADLICEAFVADIHDSDVGWEALLKLETLFRDAISAYGISCLRRGREEAAQVADAEAEKLNGINADRYWQSKRIAGAIRSLTPQEIGE